MRKVKKATAEKVKEVSEKGEMEQLFIDCIEEVRKEVMRRRFRTEVANRKANKLARASTSSNGDTSQQ